LPDETSVFDQTGLDRYGYVYYPYTCIDEMSTNCNLHVVFHGCGQSAENIDTYFVRNSGWVQYAAENHMIVLFPQVSSSTKYNPGGCWNNYYTSEN